jgi:hypothetical protein
MAAIVGQRFGSLMAGMNLGELRASGVLLTEVIAKAAFAVMYLEHKSTSRQ